MNKINLFTAADSTRLTSYRNGEIKFSERIQLLSHAQLWATELKENDSKFALIGIPEDLGVRANFGRGGTHTAWHSFLKSFLNIQHNRFCKANWFTLIGELNFDEELKQAASLDPNLKEDRKKLFRLVEIVDKEVSHTITQIVKAGKIPIVIGGGHNNAYGNIKGLALAKGKSVNAINFDAHTDFRPLEGRHSGNGFSYAAEEGFLKNYFIFGLHENYTSKGVFDSIKTQSEKIKYNTYEQIQIRKEKSFETELLAAQKHIEGNSYGIEIDLDAVPFIASSAITPSGFSAERLRQFIHFFGKSKHASYLHICEGAPNLDFETNNHLVGKFIAYLVTDFAKTNIEKI